MYIEIEFDRSFHTLSMTFTFSRNHSHEIIFLFLTVLLAINPSCYLVQYFWISF